MLNTEVIAGESLFIVWLSDFSYAASGVSLNGGYAELQQDTTVYNYNKIFFT